MFVPFGFVTVPLFIVLPLPKIDSTTKLPKQGSFLHLPCMQASEAKLLPPEVWAAVKNDVEVFLETEAPRKPMYRDRLERFKESFA